MQIITYLADVLAEKIDKSPLATRGLIKLAIQDELGPFYPLNKINYNDLKSSIHNSLMERLVKLKIQDAERWIDLLLYELKNNQSLITFSNI